MTIPTGGEVPPAQKQPTGGGAPPIGKGTPQPKSAAPIDLSAIAAMGNAMAGMGSQPAQQQPPPTTTFQVPPAGWLGPTATALGVPNAGVLPFPGQGGGRSYVIASGDLPWKVAQRFTGTIKRDDGRWTWKELDHAYPALDTTGEAPKPWHAGDVIILPEAWNVDLGPSSGASGQIGPPAVSGAAAPFVPPLSTV
jgi:hypothetical protein